MLFLLTSFFTVVANLVLGLFVFFRNPKSWQNRYFLGMTTAIALWIGTLYVYYATHNPHILLGIGRINFLAPTLIVYYLYRFVIEYPVGVSWEKPIMRWVVGMVMWGMALVAGFTPWVDKNEVLVGTERRMEFGPLYGVWIATFLLVLVASLSILLYKLAKSKGEERRQVKFLLTALSLSFGFGFLTNAFLPYVFGMHFLEPLGPVSALFMSGMTAYAIVRHRFLDITSIVARAVTYTLILLTIVGLEVGYLYAMVWLLPPNIDRVLVAASGAVLIVLSYDYLRGRINALTEQIFYQGRYDTEEVLSKLTGTMASVIEIKTLGKTLLSTIVEEMRLTCAAFVLVEDHKVKRVETVKWEEWEGLKAIETHDLLHTAQEMWVFEELAEGETKEMFRKLGVTVALPLKLKGTEIGLLLLGPKASGDIYSERDLELLSIFAPQAAVALNNAESYHQIQAFSKTLAKKVEERTSELKHEQKERLKRANELLKIKDEFVFIATHDLATPVTAIAGFVEMVKDRLAKLPRDVREDITAIDEATGRLRALVNDLLEVARGESGTIKVKLVPVDLVKTVEDAVELVTQRANEKKVKIKLTLDPQHKNVMADQAKLAEVFENLLTNAVKYNKAGGTVEVSSRAEGEKLVIAITDTGIGIPVKEQAKVFNKFYRSESEEARKQTGTGLGLFVVKMLVTKMEGSIEFDSKEGEGTTFTLTLGRG